jgi:hypothetical protein
MGESDFEVKVKQLLSAENVMHVEVPNAHAFFFVKLFSQIFVFRKNKRANKRKKILRELRAENAKKIESGNFRKSSKFGK